jgi:hypothetical protein
MKVTDPVLKKDSSGRCLHISHRNSASYARKAAKNDNYTHGILKVITATFKGNPFC